MNNHIVVRHPRQLTPQWAQRILRRSIPHATVSAVEIESVNPGTTTRTALTVEHDASAEYPRRWFVKTPALLLKSRLITALPGLLQKEIHFYNGLARHSPPNLPQVLAAQHRFGLGSTLVMADLRESGQTPGQVGDALTLTQAEAVLRELAKLHAGFSGKSALLQAQTWLNPFNAKIELALGDWLAPPLMRRGLRRAGDLIPQDLHKPALEYAFNRRRMMRQLTAASNTLVHHDCHPGNLFWTADGPGFLDWQLVRLGEGVSDVAYFLATALPSDLRREHERALLDYYRAAVSAFGGPELPRGRTFERYRRHVAYAVEAMVLTLAVGDLMEEAGNRALIARAATAAADLQTFAALGCGD